jgi:hypothetical protein
MLSAPMYRPIDHHGATCNALTAQRHTFSAIRSPITAPPVVFDISRQVSPTRSARRWPVPSRLVPSRLLLASSRLASLLASVVACSNLNGQSRLRDGDGEPKVHDCIAREHVSVRIIMGWCVCVVDRDADDDF